MALALPGDIVLYLLLPLHAASFGVTLPEAGLLLAANRLVRIAGYGWIARLYAQRGPRFACLLAAGATIAATTGYATLSGVGALLVVRLLWGLAFGVLNIANQAFPTSVPDGAARRSGRARAIVAVGPMLALALAAGFAEAIGPRTVFALLAGVAVAALVFAARLPATPEGLRPAAGPRFGRPEPMDVWSFCQGFTLDGLFVVGVSVLAAAQQPQGATLAAGAAMALRYASEIVLSPAGGALAHRFGTRRLLVALSLAAAFGLLALGIGGVLLWVGAFGTMLLRALLQPLPAPLVAEAHPGPDRVPALARQATWRDIGAGAGPLAAGLLLPVLPALLLYGGAAAMIGASSLWLARPSPRRPG